MLTRTRIKICGVRDVETARMAADCGADAVGLVFVDASPRRVSVDDARRIASSLPAFVEAVGLFVDASPEVIRATVAQVGLSVVQLHGRESIVDARAVYPLRVIRALPFNDASVAVADAWAEVDNLAGILWDTPPETGAKTTGGSGRSFDWLALARDCPRVRTPLILAGGLTADNVMEAIRVVRPWAVDVSSGVESSRGVKDSARIAAFCQAVRDADAVLAAEA